MADDTPTSPGSPADERRGPARPGHTIRDEALIEAVLGLSEEAKTKLLMFLYYGGPAAQIAVSLAADAGSSELKLTSSPSNEDLGAEGSVGRAQSGHSAD